MRLLQLGTIRNILTHSYQPSYHHHAHNLLYNTPIYAFSTATLPGYEKPLPLDVRTGKLKREFDEKQRMGLRKRNYRFRRYLVSKRRSMSRELLFGYAACRMMNKMARGNQKRLQKDLVNHLYALKLNSFRLPFMELQKGQAATVTTPKKQLRLTKRLASGSSWNMRQKRKKVVSWEDKLRSSTKNAKK
mmetsp:Transcript_61695/g.98314  ORF Transcript_61695/g.98314 Transcript_61695/m.98314 type:complete len:189 (+) Transcript_61695:30-596(+)